VVCDHVAAGKPHVIYANAQGCRSTFQILESCLVDVNDPEQPNTISIYPNPTPGYIEINGRDSDPAFISITDIHGRVVQRQRPFKEIIDIRDLPNGVYLVTIQTPEARITKRILKE
jgi:hypothetical protein